MYNEKFFNIVFNRFVHKQLKSSHRIEINDIKKSKKFSIIVACYNTPLNFLDEMINSVIEQSYENWELCIADGSNNLFIKEHINKYYKKNIKIKYKYLDGNGGISENMNVAIKMATGDYIGFFDHDDLLTNNALYEMIKVINSHDDAEMIYSDEDKINESSKQYFFPHFKPDFNLDLLLTSNYICHFLVVKRELLEKVGMFRKEFDGAQDYDFVLRCVSYLKGKGIYHIPRVLYHWRVHNGSTAGKPESKPWAFDAGKEALKDYMKCNQVKATVENGFAPGYYRVKYCVNEDAFISIIITNVLDKRQLNNCIESIKDYTSYKNYEIIVIGNKKIIDERYYEDVIYVDSNKGENDSIIKNEGAKYAKGNYLVFLDASLSVKNNDWLTEMLSLCQRNNTGIVGCKLLNKKKKIVHVGTIIGHNGQYLYPYQGRQENTFGYNGYVQSIRDYSAVSCDCFMINKTLFYQVEGFNENLNKSINGIDLCLRIRSLNKLVVYDPFVCLQFDTNHIKKGISKVDKDYLSNQWHSYVINDPMYNPHFSDKHAYTLDVNSKL